MEQNRAFLFLHLLIISVEISYGKTCWQKYSLAFLFCFLEKEFDSSPHSHSPNTVKQQLVKRGTSAKYSNNIFYVTTWQFCFIQQNIAGQHFREASPRLKKQLCSSLIPTCCAF